MQPVDRPLRSQAKFYLSDEAHDKLKVAAKAAGLTFSDALEYFIINETLPPATPAKAKA